MKTVDEVEVQAVVKFPVERLRDLLCCAFEGGSNYWYMIEEFHMPPSLKDVPSDQVFRHLDYPTREGGYLVVSDAGLVDEIGESSVKKTKIDLLRLKEALQLMAVKYPRHFSDFMQGNDDAITGDVFLQLAVFGDVVYG